MNREAFFRCDTRPQSGGGHYMRCLSLAYALSKKNMKCTIFIDPDFKAISSNSNISLEIIPEGVDDVTLILSKSSNDTEIMVIDHYEFSIDKERRLHNSFHVLVAIDDLANREHDVDILIDTDLKRGISDYSKLVNINTNVLIGPKYALLRTEFIEKSSCIKRNYKHIKNILICLGLSPDDSARRFINELSRILGKTGFNIRIIFGSSVSSSVQVSSNLLNNIHVEIEPELVSEHMIWADCALTSGGSICFELACMGLPALVMILADNQIRNVRNFSDTGSVISLGRMTDTEPLKVANKLIYLSKQPKLFNEMSKRGQSLIDGQGCDKIVNILYKAA